MISPNSTAPIFLHHFHNLVEISHGITSSFSTKASLVKPLSSHPVKMLSNRDMLKSLPFCTESPKQHIFHSKVCHFKIHFPVCPVFQVGENLQLRCNPPQIFSEECVTCLVLPKCQFWTRKIQEFCLNTTENKLFFQTQQGKNFAYKLRRPPCLPERTRHLLRRTRSPSDFTFPLGSDLICSHSMRIH